MLSFGEEAEEEEKELASVKEKIKSSHDVLNDPRLLKEPPTNDSVLVHYLFLEFMMFFHLYLHAIYLEGFGIHANAWNICCITSLLILKRLITYHIISLLD